MAGLQEVEMLCIREFGGERGTKVVVVSPGDYEGYYVNMSRSARVPGRRFRGLVYPTDKVDAERRYCVLADSSGKRDPKAYDVLIP